MKNTLLVICVLSTISVINAMDKKPFITKEVEREIVDDNNRLVRINAQGKIIEETEDQEFMIYRANKYILPTLAIATGALAIASMATMNPAVILTNAVAGGCLCTSGFIKATQSVEDRWGKKCGMKDGFDV